MNSSPPPSPPAAGNRWRALRGRRIQDGDLRHDANIFTILRWILASAVIFSHSYDVVFGSSGLLFDPSREVLPFRISRLAVLLFFSLSGFLVTGSLIKRGVRDFILSRGLRLIPGLWVMLIVTSVLLGLFFNAGTLSALLHGPSLHRYLAFNMALLGKHYSLDGVFDGLPMPHLVNGSLWTIAQEVRCYVALALIGLTGMLRGRRAVTIVFAVLVIVDLLVPADAVRILTIPRPLAVAFFFGVLLYLWRDRLILSWPLALGVTLAALLLPGDRLAQTAVALAFAYLLIVAAIRVPGAWKRFSAAIPDYSYGIYIYAFPAQQAAAALGFGNTPAENMVAGFALTLPFAALSWHLVEKPALGLKGRWMRRPAAARSATLGTG